MKINPILGAAILLFASATSAYGAILHTDGSGNLIGASGVDVGGNLYDVEFVDGSCIDLFNGCDSRSDFTFNTWQAALAASEALLSQVFIDSGGVLFDSIPSATTGCEAYPPYGVIDSISCLIYTPFGLEDSSPFYEFDRFIEYTVTANSSLEAYDSAFIGNDFSAYIDVSAASLFNPETGLRYDNQVFARWTPNPVPIPAAIWLFGAALVGLVGFSRRNSPTGRT